MIRTRSVMEDSTEQSGQCFVCDKDLSLTSDHNVVLLSNITKYSKTSLPTKIGQLMGDGFMVIVSACDEACARCFDLLNLLDKLEVDLDKVRHLLTAYLRKKYGLLESVKQENSEMYESSDLMDEVSTRCLEEEVNQALYGKENGFETSLDAERKAAVTAENSRICSLLRAAMNARRLVESAAEVKTLSSKFIKCSKCNLKCKGLRELKLHEKSHLSTSALKRRSFSCNVCDFKTTSKTECDNHIQKHVVIKTFKCDVCDKIFESQKSLDQHANTHNVYQCADCGAAYELLENLMVHDCMSQEDPGQSLTNSSDVKIEHLNEDSSVGITVTPDIVTRASHSSDFDALCRDTLKGEAEFSNQLNDSLEQESEGHAHINQAEDSLPAEEACGNSEFHIHREENLDSSYGNPLSSMEQHFDSDDDFDTNDIDNGEEAYDDDEDDMLEDDSEDSLDNDKPGDSKESKNFDKIFVDGIEVSFSDIVGQETESLSVEDLMSSDIYENPENCGISGGKRKVFVCSVCKFRTPDDNTIRKHLETHNISLALECEVCKLKLKTQRTFHKHMKRHLDSLKSPAPATCKVCKELIPDRFGMRKHMTDSHPELFKCQYCGEVCDSVRARQRHEASHTSVSERTCDVCGKVFRKPTQLQIHREYAHRDPKCRHCGKVFDTAKKLKDHERRHSQNREGFPCSQCDRVLKTSSGLKLHRAKHTGQYKFCCDVCGRGFMSKAIMEEHMGRHTQEKRYTCDVCGKMFVFNSTMRIHRRWHDNPFPYKCKTCGQKFRHTSLLSVHRRRMHTGERPYKCPYCPLTFTVSNCLKRHVVLHTGAYPYFCEPCRKGFTTKQKIAVHLAKVHNNREMLNAKAPPCEYKMVIPNQPIQAPPESDDERTYVNPMDDVEHVEVEHIIVQGEEQQIDAEGNIQLQIITMDADHAFSVFE